MEKPRGGIFNGDFPPGGGELRPEDVTTAKRRGMAVKVRKEYIAELTGCPRCGEDHENLMFQPLANPQDEHTFYSLCPETAQPVLLTGEEMGE